MVVVLDGVVCPSMEVFGYASPLVAVHPVHRKQPLLLLLAEWLLVDVWVQLVVPSQSAAFPYKSSKEEKKDPFLRI